MSAVNVLFDLCQHPEHIESLRDKATATFTDGHGWEFGTVKKLALMDSFFKESVRYNPPDTRK